MKKYYVSLVCGLIGYYVVFEAPDKETVQKHCAAYFGRMWCGVYDEYYFTEYIAGKFGVESIINADKPIRLESWVWE